MITRQDFKLYRDAPLHLWAKLHNQLHTPPITLHQQLLFDQSREVKRQGREFLLQRLARQGKDPDIQWQQGIACGDFYATPEALVFDPASQSHDLYELTSSTSAKTEVLQDMAYHWQVCSTCLTLRDAYLVHLNSTYTPGGSENLFELEYVTEKLKKQRPMVQEFMQQVEKFFDMSDPQELEGCAEPQNCPCPSLCHSGLPDYSIYEINRLNKKDALKLKKQGVLAISELPEDYPLSEFQRRQVSSVRSAEAWVDREAVQRRLRKLQFPLCFLDYETFNPAIPWFAGYHPYNPMVFQFSPDVLEQPQGEAQHFEFLCTQPGDPAPQLLEQLARSIPLQGSVIVWYEKFEGERNREMAQRYPQHAPLLQGINSRLFDLMAVFSDGCYVHPDFHGSNSLKDILPVLAPGMSYAGLAVTDGNDAMAHWACLMQPDTTVEEKQKLAEDLLVYCGQDTRAMVEIYRLLTEI
jgi:hypothetical protein